MLAHRITRRLSEVRKADVLRTLRPDGKRRSRSGTRWMPTAPDADRDRRVLILDAAP